MGQGQLDPERGYLDKWEMYKALQDENIGDCSLPVTLPYDDRALLCLLEEFEAVYLKQVDSWGGRQVSRIEREGDGTWRWSRQEHEARLYPDLRRLLAEVQEVYAGHRCIVQQAAPLVGYEGRAFDIRVHLQMDLDGSWVYGGDLVRVSGAGSIVSNVAISGGKVLSLEQIATDVLPDGAGGLPELRRRLARVGELITGLLAEYRDFNEVGIDLGVDDSGRLWLIEVNTDDANGAPSLDLFEQLPDKSVYQAMRQRFEGRALDLLRWFMSFGEPDEEASEAEQKDAEA
jgi:hypothetical protein